MVDERDAMTQRLLVDAGIAPGMRVLDVGCGSGGVSFMLAQLVGKDGQVVGVDRDPRPLAIARERAQALGFTNVRFEEGNFDGLSTERDKFDAGIGRRVLMYQPDPVDALRQLARALRPGGLVIFQEHDSVTVPNLRVSIPLHDRVRGWIWETIKREGADIHMGLGLATALARAGLAVESVRAEAIVLTPTIMRYPTVEVVRAVLPRIVQQGVATEQEIDVDTLDRRLADERVKADTTSIWELVFGAWARKPE